ncbi:hypothetical protein I1A49_13005 [Streptomyces malaysiensis subsp. malaysiensis]|uniref:Uncharacterized protein n=1 Tax=Streptomyces malaysiensis TaxID=92644 RepID=A0ABX6W2I3_STRMQ|nr:hypothetical protein [Streptomyces solisilvae]QPI55720.1 hypothetical protein I1A49_13005 [Streptomyces solisilvae]
MTIAPTTTATATTAAMTIAVVLEPPVPGGGGGGGSAPAGIAPGGSAPGVWTPAAARRAAVRRASGPVGWAGRNHRSAGRTAPARTGPRPVLRPGLGPRTRPARLRGRVRRGRRPEALLRRLRLRGLRRRLILLGL